MTKSGSTGRGRKQTAAKPSTLLSVPQEAAPSPRSPSRETSHHQMVRFVYLCQEGIKLMFPQQHEYFPEIAIASVSHSLCYGHSHYLRPAYSRSLFSSILDNLTTTKQCHGCNRERKILRTFVPSRVAFPTELTRLNATPPRFEQFINLVSGSEFAINEGLKSCTDKVQVAKALNLGGRHIVLIDTPGFDDTVRSDTDVLKMVAAFLGTSCVNLTLNSSQNRESLKHIQVQTGC